MGDTKSQYVAPANTDFPFAFPKEGGPLFLPSLEHLQTLYPGAYARGPTSTSEGAETNLDVKLSAHTHPVAAVLDSLLGGGDPSPT